MQPAPEQFTASDPDTARYFLLINFGVSGTRLRDVLVARMGAGPYRSAFALASLVGIVWMSRAYGRAPTVDLWGQLIGLRPLAFALVLVAFLFVGIGLATPSPYPSRHGIKALAGDGHRPRHCPHHAPPVSLGRWHLAFVHLIVNGDLASLILFGSLLRLALGGTASIDAKRRRSFGDQWSRFAQATSNVPFGAIATGRNQLSPALREIGILRPVIATAAFTLILIFHQRLFGAPLV